MSVLFGRGAFDAQAALLSAQALAAYAVGLPAFVLLKVLVPAFFAHGDTSTPVKAGCAAIALNLALNLAFMAPLQHAGPALATSVSAVFNCLVLGAVLSRRGHLAVDAQLRRRMPRMALAALAMATALWAATFVVFEPSEALPGLRWAGLGALVALGLGAYGLAGQALGAFDVRELRDRLRRGRRA